MAKIYSKEKLPKRIEGYSIYPLNDDVIIRANSGFTSDGVKNDPKYELTRHNASEFGRVSSLCKIMRLSLMGILPKNSGRGVSNLLVKKMKSVVFSDRRSLRGNRRLCKAFLNEMALREMIGYDFNPNYSLPHVLKKNFTLNGLGCLILNDLNFADSFLFPEKSNCIGIRLHHLDFDFVTGESSLSSSGWLFFEKDSTITDFIIDLAYPAALKGVLFSLAELQFFVFEDGFVPLVDDVGKIVTVLGCSNTLKVQA
ncbi:MAG: hypothetical protein EOO46_06640 [Flavobacterium sp.]|nr:MAG: hypothetical protein EOO46_06640 [Flavobacterium sp.]